MTIPNEVIVFGFIEKTAGLGREEAPDVFGDKTLREFIDAYESQLFNNHGIYKYMGWVYNLQDVMKKYVYENYDRWFVGWAVNKAAVRRQTYGPVTEILESKKR